MRRFWVVKSATSEAPGSPISIKYISPSALETFLDCPRKWAWTKIDRLPKPQNPNAALGQEMHTHHENYLKHGKPYDLTTYSGKLAQCTQHLLPAPGSIPYEVEKERTIEISGVKVIAPQYGGEATIRVAGIVFGGRQDLRWGEIRPQGRVAVVHDHKSTGSLHWAKDTKEKLLDHPQAPIYALIGMRDYETELAELRWTYALKDDRPKPFKSWHMVTADEAYAAVSKFLEPASHMQLVVDLANRKGLRTLNLPFNPGACDKFGGCPFKSKCNLTRKEVHDMVNSPNFGDFLQSLKAQNPAMASAVPNAAPAAQAQATPSVQALPFAVPGVAPTVAPPAQQTPPTQQAPGYGLLFPNDPGAQVAQAPAVPAPQHYGNAVNPPEAALPPAPEPQATAPAAAEPTKRKRRTKAEMEAARAAEAQSASVVVTADEAVSAPEASEPVTSEGESPKDTFVRYSVYSEGESPKDTFVRYSVYLAGDFIRQGASPEQAANFGAQTYMQIQALANQAFPG